MRCFGNRRSKGTFMTIHMPTPSLDVSQHGQGFEVVKATAAWIALRQPTEGHVFTFFFNPARTALASVHITQANAGRYHPAYFEEAAWRYADAQARQRGLIFARRVAA
jgi:hypothetical protein